MSVKFYGNLTFSKLDDKKNSQMLLQNKDNIKQFNRDYKIYIFLNIYMHFILEY